MESSVSIVQTRTRSERVRLLFVNSGKKKKRIKVNFNRFHLNFYKYLAVCISKQGYKERCKRGKPCQCLSDVFMLQSSEYDSSFTFTFLKSIHLLSQKSLFIEAYEIAI